MKERIVEKGYMNVNVQDLIQDMTPRALAIIPTKTRQDLLKDVKRFLAQQAEV